MLNPLTRLKTDMEAEALMAKANPSHQPLSVVTPNLQINSVVPPLFDLVEEDDYYLLAIDLPGMPELATGVEMRKGELQVTRRQEQDPLTTDVLFRSRSSNNRVRVVYYEGALWLLMPKNGRSVELRGVKQAGEVEFLPVA